MAGVQSGKLNDNIIIPSSTILYDVIMLSSLHHTSHLTYFAYSELVSVERKKRDEILTKTMNLLI